MEKKAQIFKGNMFCLDCIKYFPTLMRGGFISPLNADYCAGCLKLFGEKKYGIESKENHF